MDSTLRPAPSLSEHRGSYSSIRSTKSARNAGGMWTPPISPSTETMQTFEDSVESNDDKGKERYYEDEDDEEDEDEDMNDDEEVAIEPEQEERPELRLSDFQVVNTLGTEIPYIP